MSKEGAHNREYNKQKRSYLKLMCESTGDKVTHPRLWLEINKINSDTGDLSLSLFTFEPNTK